MSTMSLDIDDGDATGGRSPVLVVFPADGAPVLKGLSRTLEFTVEPPAVGPELESESTAL